MPGKRLLLGIHGVSLVLSSFLLYLMAAQKVAAQLGLVLLLMVLAAPLLMPHKAKTKPRALFRWLRRIRTMLAMILVPLL